MSEWDQNFFTVFVSLRNSIYKDQHSFIPESIEQVRLELSESSFLASLWLDNDTPVARVILFWSMEKCYFGYFEILESMQLNQDIINWIEIEAKKKQATQIKGPIQANFFVSYRFKLNGEFKFYGEPYHQNFYPDYFLKNDFIIEKKWHTYLLDQEKAKLNYNEIHTRHVKKKGRTNSNIKVKFITPWRFKVYLDHCFYLFHNSYKNMPEFTPVSYEKFCKLYAGFNLIVNPFFSYLVFWQNKAVAFNINFFDPLPLIANYQKGPSTLLRKLKLLIQIKLNNKNLMINYVGKDPEIDGRVKGIQSIVAKYIYFFCKVLRVKNVYYGYVAEDSPSLKSFGDTIKPVCEYAIVIKTL